MPLAHSAHDASPNFGRPRRVVSIPIVTGENDSVAAARGILRPICCANKRDGSRLISHVLGGYRLSVLIVLTLFIALLALAVPPVLAATSISPGTTTVVLNPPERHARYNAPLTLTGSVTPANAGVEVVVQRTKGAGKRLATSTTSSNGTFSIQISPKRVESLVARVPAWDSLSESVTIPLRPKITSRIHNASAFSVSSVKISVKPSEVEGTARLTFRRKGNIVKRYKIEVINGVGRRQIVMPGPGFYSIITEIDAPRGFALSKTYHRIRVTARILDINQKGRDVSGLARKLRALKFYVPDYGNIFNDVIRDAVIAFQKSIDLPRTGFMGYKDWKALGNAVPMEATQKGPPNRIEVDQSRQILIKVRRDKVVGVLPVSTGATGNTPEGVHKIRWKALATRPLEGPGRLYRTMTFWGDIFAIHGWWSVPSEAASGGCVRVPLWGADWLYNRSRVGETVIVHS